MLWSSPSTSIDGTSQESLSTMVARQKYSSCRPSKMGYDKKKLKEPMKPLYGSGGKRIESIRVITLPISFGTPQKPRTEYITFNMVNMLYPYNVIFERGLLNNLKAALHSGYLCFKIPATFSIITVFGNQKEARSIERGLP
jgi:hypothetical protein